mmetsp:Transcript_10869/g.40551  ORF Transcript_10869/g.40551 Transcript_10869/m.40551 type:complete len:86 (-) Transcript_10869:418-675(-)
MRRRLYVGWDLGFEEGLQYGAGGNASSAFSATGGPGRGYRRGGFQSFGGGVPRGTYAPQRGEKRYRENDSLDMHQPQHKRRRFEE